MHKFRGRCPIPTNPNNVNPVVWECAPAYRNVCFSPEHVESAEMYRLRDDLDGKLKGRIGLDTLEWIWDRLAKTGPHGKQYAERFRPMFEECFPPQVGKP